MAQLTVDGVTFKRAVQDLVEDTHVLAVAQMEEARRHARKVYDESLERVLKFGEVWDQQQSKPLRTPEAVHCVALIAALLRVANMVADRAPFEMSEEVYVKWGNQFYELALGELGGY